MGCLGVKVACLGGIYNFEVILDDYNKINSQCWICALYALANNRAETMVDRIPSQWSA